VNRACLVLLSAHLEGFLEDLVVEALDALVQNGARVERLPLLLRAIHAEEHLRAIEPMKDRNARAPRIGKLFSAESPMWVTGTIVQRQMVRQKTVCSEMENPGSREIRQFLALVGVDIAHFLESRGAMFALSRIDGLVGRRNAIAHGEASTSATFKDVDGYLSNVEELSQHIDAAVADTVKGICLAMTLPW